MPPLATPEAFEALEPTDLCRRYRVGIENIDRRVLKLSERQLDTAFLPEAGVGRWPVRVLLGHLADAELVYVHRMRRAIGEENPVVAVFDENAFIDSNLYGHVHEGYAEDEESDHARVMNAVGGHLAVIHTLRQWHGAWLFGRSGADWSRRIMHPENGPMTLKRLLAYDTWHLEHHAGFLRKKLDQLVGGEADGAPAAGHAGCGCSH
jgi:uncharacterized damage-inducible protein DinB